MSAAIIRRLVKSNISDTTLVSGSVSRYINAASFSSSSTTKKEKKTFPWNDALLLRDQLTEEEQMIADTAKSFCQEKLMPRIVNANRNESFDPAIMREMGELGLLGPTLKGYGCAGIGR